MAHQQPIDDALLAKFLAGETDPGESARVQQWLASQDSAPDEPTQDDFASFERIWQTAKPADHKPIDTDAAWKSVQQKMRFTDKKTDSGPDSVVVKPIPVIREQTTETNPTSLRSKPSFWRSPIWRVAAVLIVAIGVGWSAFQFLHTEKTTEQYITLRTTDQRLERVLPDGTKIMLNRNSTLRYPAEFDDDHRDVALTGEAFFDVMPDPKRPFRIQARQTSVQVLGTSFNVRAYDANVSVAVQTGKVRFASQRKAVLLTPNQQATFEADADTIRRSWQQSANVFAYKTGQLVFTNEPLRDVVKTLNQVYNADIRLANDKIGSCLLNTRFDNTPLPAVIDITAESLSLRVRHEGKQVILDGAGCQ